MGNAEGKIPAGSLSLRWDDLIKIGLKDGDGAWTGLIWLRIRTASRSL